MQLKTVFMGTAEIACAPLRALASDPRFELVSVVSQPDRPKGRELKLVPTPVKSLALELGLPVEQPERARRPEFQERVRHLAPDLVVVMAYGQILPQSLLDIPRLGCFNLHTSLLPKYRGAAPIQAALLNGDTVTGITIIKMDAGMDTGPIVAMEQLPIQPEDTAQTLHDRLAELSGKVIIPTLLLVASGQAQIDPQPAEGISYTSKITKEQGLLDWQQPAEALKNRIRAFNPWPGSFTYYRKDDRKVLVKVWKARAADGVGKPGHILAASGEGIVVACGRGTLILDELQKEGGKRLHAAAFLSGFPLREGTSFVNCEPSA